MEITKVNEIKTGMYIKDPYVLFFVGCLLSCMGSKNEKNKSKVRRGLMQQSAQKGM